MLETENAYGMRKRFLFVQETIKQYHAQNILDIGCGTGGYLTTPLAQSFPDISFYAVDSDKTSIEYARNNNHFDKLIFGYPEEIPTNQLFDIVIASEVIEHVEHPGEFLRYLRRYLNDNGIIILTTPNGYGPFEIATLCEALFHFSGIRGLARRIKNIISPSRKLSSEHMDTLAISPHLNFFSLKELNGLFKDAGLHLVCIRSRTFLCGYLLDSVLRGNALLEWNTRIADKLPHRFNSDWMFILEKANVIDQVVAPYKRNAYARFRKRVSLKRSG
jgi:2-polyprenyl-3-methyl-5-hydroxy-6-metoxy-1,4-benzoquinol methylase